MKNKVIIGSRAIHHYFNDFKSSMKDIDIAYSDEKYIDRNETFDNTRVEYLYNPIICKYTNSEYLEPDLMLTLKLSHCFWDINWDKHVEHIQFLLSKNCKPNIEILNELRKFWENYLPTIRRSDLNKNKEEFFTNNVNEDTNEHDIYHTYITDIPMYRNILIDGKEVEVCEKKFNKLSHKDKLAIITEECSVMAYERYRKTKPYYVAYRIQLKDCLIKHFPQFVALYGLMNYIELTKYRKDYYKLIDNGIEISRGKK